MHILILAGGEGSRLWPLSRQEFPKQFLRFGKHSLLQKTVERFVGCPLAESIAVATSAQHEQLVLKQLKEINADVHLIVEPCRRNTAPAIAFGVQYLQDKLGLSDEAEVLVLPSDHLIEPEDVFLRSLKQVGPLLRQERLVLFGVRPTRAETGYGYIEVEKDEAICKVKRFVEKPDRERAESYVASGKYYWNMGMFAFSIGLFWQKLKAHAPLIASLIAAGRFEEMPSVSFDYAVLEKCDGIAVCPLPVYWSDVGSWESIYEALEKDEHQNATVGNVFNIDTKNSLILGGKKLISTIGLEDLVIVETEEAIFISKKRESQKVKDLVQQLLKFGKIS